MEVVPDLAKSASNKTFMDRESEWKVEEKPLKLELNSKYGTEGKDDGDKNVGEWLVGCCQLKRLGGKSTERLKNFFVYNIK